MNQNRNWIIISFFIYLMNGFIVGILLDLLEFNQFFLIGLILSIISWSFYLLLVVVPILKKRAPIICLLFFTSAILFMPAAVIALNFAAYWERKQDIKKINHEKISEKKKI